jgi:hypothetical protein
MSDLSYFVASRCFCNHSCCALVTLARHAIGFLETGTLAAKLPPIFVRVEKGEWEARLDEGGIIYTQLVVKNMWG